MNSEKLQAPKADKGVLSLLNIFVFSIIVAAMAVFLVVLLYQWFTRPVPYAAVAPVYNYVSALV